MNSEQPTPPPMFVAPTADKPQPFRLVPDSERLRRDDWADQIGVLIAVTGASSNAGKTGTAVEVIRTLKQLGRSVTALKLTRTHTTRCPRENDDCGTCESLTDDYEVVIDRQRLDVRGKDTGRYFEAGADQVLWLLVRPEATARGVRAVLKHVSRGHDLVAEGNSFRDAADATLTLMAVSEREAIKPSASAILDRVDAVVIRGSAGPSALAVANSTAGQRPMIELPSLGKWLRASLVDRGWVPNWGD